MHRDTLDVSDVKEPAGIGYSMNRPRSRSPYKNYAKQTREHVQKRSTSEPPYKSPSLKVFDPSTDPHLWAMWRIAVTERIVTETLMLSQQSVLTRDDKSYWIANTLTTPPLSRYLQKSKPDSADQLMSPDGPGSGSQLVPGQFIYYGMPRASLHSNFGKMGDFYEHR